MDQKILALLNNTADEFGKIAKKVNEASKKRKNYSEEAINYIDQCLEIEEVLDRDIESVSAANIGQRNKDTIVLNSCKILKSNIEGQNQILNELQKKNLINKETYGQLSSKIKEFSQTLEEALSDIQRIIENDNKIILMDNIIRKRKEYQRESIIKLKDLAKMSLEDAEKAIEGSSSNLDRGLQMVEKYKNTERYISEKNKQGLNNLIEEANKGWNIAVVVNKSSNSQFEFAEKVNTFTCQLHQDSMAIKDLVIQKHREFEENIQIVTVLTVILSLKFKKYLAIEKVIDGIEADGNMRELLLNLAAYIKIACQDIRDIAALNYDMTDSSNLNSVVEDNTVKSTRKELEYFDNIKKEVELMTEATRYPVEGSGKNIANGQILEKQLKEIVADLQ